MIDRHDIFLREAAWNYLLEQQITELPINVFELAVQCGYIVMTYKKYSEVINKPIEYIIEKYDNDGFVFWSVRLKSFVICYNDVLAPVTVRWTIMHEIAHIVLGHVTPDAPALTRIRKIDHPYIESEADGFTRRVLCPSIVLHDCRAIEIWEIMRLCGISREAATHRHNYIKILEKRGKWCTDPLEAKVKNQFKPFINKYLSSKHDIGFLIEIAA